MKIKVALAGNPNSGKSTLFNILTGSNQYVGNWPGVTVEKKEGIYKKDSDIEITDLPGIYSLSPYTLEEVVSRNFLIDENPDVIIDVVDGTNIERNLYLATQLLEIGAPVVIALNMMDVVRKNKDEIDVERLKKELGCEIVEISALKNENLDKLMETVKKVSKEKTTEVKKIFDSDLENEISNIIEMIPALKNNRSSRWYAVKLIESDDKLALKVPDASKEKINGIIYNLEQKYDDDGEGIITDGRYNFVSEIASKCVKKGTSGLTVSDKIDRIVTNRILALPIFAVFMFGIYYIAATIVGGPVTDWANDDVIGGFAAFIQGILENAGTSEWLTSLVVDGIIGGVGAVLGFLPFIAVLYFFLAILEDCGYMSRIAFILDRIFRRFGLSGKSFIPILIGTGCSIPAVMGTRTIENDRDRRMTIICSSFLPCGAKTDIIALFVASFGYWYFAPIAYFGGIVAVIITGIILKKTSIFEGDPAPFVMELPEYHFPSPRNVLKSVGDRCLAFAKKAGTVILLATVAIWILQNISVNGEFVAFDADTDSILSAIGKMIAPIFIPTGFGNWIATVASISGLVAKEVVVSTYGILAGLGESEDALHTLIANEYTIAAALSFMFFNQLTIPCFAAVGALKAEMNSRKWTLFAVGYQLIFSYTVAIMIYQFGTLISGGAFTVWTGVAFGILAVYLYLLFRKKPERRLEKVEKVTVQG